MPRREIIAWCLAAAVLALALGPAAACPTCKAALASHDAAGGDLVGGFMWSILFMMAMPFVILGSLATLFYLQVRRARAARPSPPPVVAPSAPVENREPLAV